MLSEAGGVNAIGKGQNSMKTEAPLRHKANNINTLGQKEVGEKPGQCIMESRGGQWGIWDPKPSLTASKTYVPMLSSSNIHYMPTVCHALLQSLP